MTALNIKRVFIANRGEIAVRVIRACQALGIESVVGFSTADKETMAARLADRAVCIGPPPATESYLKIPYLITAALGTGCDALHPGYGFLAESTELAQACAENNIKFIGPQPENISNMGNKLKARSLVARHGVPTLPGSKKVDSYQEATEVVNTIGYPVMIKAAAGGGGLGIQIVTENTDLKQSFENAAAEARSAFGDDTLFIERYIPNARHIEVQALGDRYGNVIHLGERDCSLQRRYQKLIEEAPATNISERLRAEIRVAGATIAREMKYEGAGTVEFIVDQDTETFYFLEMNTRIQVEHPVTEMITGLDLVQYQLRIANGECLDLAQSQVRFNGHAIECRINAESPTHNFWPSPGRLSEWTPPQGEGVRVDTHCYPGYTVPPYYDSLLAKLIVWGENRDTCIQRVQKSLAEFFVSGVDTTISFHQFIARQQEFIVGGVNTRWVEHLVATAPKR